MLPCLSSTPHVFPTSKPYLAPNQALFLLQNCHHFTHLKQIHAHIIRSSLSHHQLLTTKLIHLYSSHSKTAYAIFLFHQFQYTPTTFTCNLIIRAHTLNAHPQQSLLLFHHMISLGIPPDQFTFPFVLKACTTSSAFRLGKVVHALLIKSSFSADTYVQNNLIDFYFKCRNKHCGFKVFQTMRAPNVVSSTTVISGLIALGEVEAARIIFDQMPFKNVVTWTSMINGYIRSHQPEEALELFWRMQAENVCPNEYTMVNLIKACAEMGIPSLGQRIHEFAINNGFEVGVYLGTALIDMYSKCGSVKEAIQVFETMPEKGLPTWNSMITSLGVHGFGEEALNLFRRMEKENVKPDGITFVGVLSACLHTKNAKLGYAYFRRMREHYSITPILEHYKCMAELYLYGMQLKFHR